MCCSFTYSQKFSSRGEPWCFMSTIPQIFIQDRKLEVTRRFPDPLNYQMFCFWKSPITQWQLINHVSNSTALPQVRAAMSGQPNRGGLTWKLHLQLELQCWTKLQVPTEDCAKKEPSCQVSCAACSDSTTLSSLGWMLDAFSEGHFIIPGIAAVQRHQ